MQLSRARIGGPDASDPGHGKTLARAAALACKAPCGATLARGAVLACSAGLACGTAASPTAVERPAPAATTATAGPPTQGGPVRHETQRSHLLVERHAPEAAQAQVLPLALAGAGVQPLAEVRRAAMPNPNWPAHFLTVTGHGGGTRWASGEPDGSGWKLVARTIGAAEALEIALPAMPSALLVAGEVVLVGAENMVGAVDLAAATPAWTEVHRRPDMKFKAYDLFARAGSWVVAIDDVVRPLYADSLRLDARGLPTHTAGWTLPGVINGHYAMAALVPTGERDGTLFVVAPYGIMDGHGQDLAALPIAGDAVKYGDDVTLNATRLTAPPVLEEHVSRATGKTEKIAAGAEVTPWRGLAVDAGRVLLAAEGRGLLVLPVDFTPETRAQAVEVGGPCHDVLVADGRTWVLVGGDASALVELAWTGDEARELARTPLRGSWDRFVR